MSYFGIFAIKIEKELSILKFFKKKRFLDNRVNFGIGYIFSEY